jgi:Xaa-Pro aminopeptidase
MKVNNVKAYIVPSCDAHQSEYISSRDGRRSFISKFNGSAGTAVVFDQKALLWTDGRYFLQASQQLSSDWQLMKQGVDGVPTINEYLKDHLQDDDIVGIDPLLFTHTEVSEMKNLGLNVKSFNENFIDLIWSDQPAKPNASVSILKVEFSGKDHQLKIKSIQEKIIKENVWGLIVTALDEIAWLFNLRGSDINFNPVFLSYAIVTLDKVYLYIDQNKLDTEAKSHLQGIEIKEYDAIFSDLTDLSKFHSDKKVLIDKKCNLALINALHNEKMIEVQRNPIELAKAIKNETEIKGFFSSHQRDAVALCRYFNWLEKELKSGKVVSEAQGADRLEKFRSEMQHFKGLSFDTISSTGPNGNFYF